MSFLNMIKDEIVEFIRETQDVIVETSIYQRIKSNKKQILITLLFIAFVGSFTYYLYVPKMSDVEKYQQEKNVAGMCELIDKTFRHLEDNGEKDKYREVRSRAIVALAEMHDSEGTEYLEKKVLDENIWNYEINREIVKALVNADNKYLENICRKYMNMADTQKDFNSKIKIYDELNKFAIHEISVDYISAVIYKDALKNLNNNIINDKNVCDYINQKIFSVTNYSFDNKLIFEKYSKLVNLFSQGYETTKMREIDNELAEEQKTINSLNYYFSPEGQNLIRNVAQQIYAEKGERAALEYINEAHRTFDENLKKLWGTWDKINKLNYKKNHISEEKNNALKEKDNLYNILHRWANRYENKDGVPINTLNINWEDSSAYINNLQFVVRGDNGDKVYKASNINAFDLSNLIPENVSVIDNKFIFKKNADKLIEIDLELNAEDFSKINAYLSEKYGEPFKSEASKARYFVEWRKDKLVLQLRYNKAGNSNTFLRCIDREIFEQRP